MNKVKLIKGCRLLWDKKTKDIIVDIKDAGPRSVTECWRDDTEFFETDDRIKHMGKIKTAKLTATDDLNSTSDLTVVWSD